MKRNWLFAGAFGLIAAIVYFASMATYAFPGESAHLMAVWRGLQVGEVQYPLMAAFAKLFGAGNVLAPLCGIVAVMVFFHLIAAFVSWRIDKAENLVAVDQQHRLSMIAALVASFVFLFTPAVHSAATHLEPRLFDFTWALLSFALVFPSLRFPRGGRFVLALSMGVMVGFGLCDSALFLTFLPFYVALVTLVSLRLGRSAYLPVFFFLATLFIAFLSALAIFDLEMVAVLRRLAADLSGYWANPGWVFVLIFATIPFLVALFSSGRVFSQSTGLVQWIFHGALTFVVVLAVATPLSPSALMEPYGIAPVATSAFAAAVAGYLAAFWWLNRDRVIALIAGGILSFVLLVSSVWFLFSFNGDAGAFADKVAERILKDLGTRTWFVTDGLLDDHLKLVAADLGREINIVSLARDMDKEYCERLAKIVEAEGIAGSKNASLRLSLDLGVLPFVQDWFACDPSVVKEVAVFGAPDLWYTARITPVPEFFFFGADDSVVPDWSAWKEFDAILKAPKGWGSYHDRKVTNPMDRLRYSLRRHLGFVANNRGVYLQDKGKDAEAFAMYELVLNEIDHDNICSIFNEVEMIGSKFEQAVAKKRELERMLKSAMEDKERRYLLWRLGTYYGYIRNTETFIRLGHVWARSGRPGDAITQIRRAIDFVPSDKRTVLLNMMASLYASDFEQVKSRRIYEAILEKNQRDHDALIGLMRLELVEGNTEKAVDYLSRALDPADKSARAKIESAMLAMMKGDSAAAKATLKAVTDADGKNMQAWSLLAAVTMQQIDAEKDEKKKAAIMKELEKEILPQMEQQAGDQLDYYLQATKGFISLRKGDAGRREARDAFVAAARQRPDISTTSDMVLGLDISLDDKEHAEAQARDMLRRNRNAPLANYVMGSLALGRGKDAEAESYLRKAADAAQPVPLALNDLAELLRRAKRFDEAEKYARKATEKAPELYVAWETLGSVLVDAGDPARLDEAEADIRKACQLSKDKNGNEADVRMLISLARVQLKRGDKMRAKVTVRKVRARVKELSDFERAEFEKVEQQAK